MKSIDTPILNKNYSNFIKTLVFGDLLTSAAINTLILLLQMLLLTLFQIPKDSICLNISIYRHGLQKCLSAKTRTNCIANQLTGFLMIRALIHEQTTMFFREYLSIKARTICDHSIPLHCKSIDRFLQGTSIYRKAFPNIIHTLFINTFQ